MKIVRNILAVIFGLIIGGNIVGKTVCEDMCYSGNSWTSSTGPVKNPFNDEYSSGGSSSGSGVLVSKMECLCSYTYLHTLSCCNIMRTFN